MIILLTSILILSFLGYYMFYFVEESHILTLRARIVVLGFMSLLLLMLTFAGIDDNYHREYLQKWITMGEPISDNFYYFGAGLLAALTLGLYIQNSTWSSQLIVFSLALILARLVHYYMPEQVFAAALYSVAAYYLLILLSNLFQNPLERIPAVLAAFFLPIPFVLFADSWLFHHYFGTYTALIFVGGIWIRFFWVLEYKRRQKCPECSGWGKKTARFKDVFWWALGYKERTQSYDYGLEMKQSIMQLLGYKDYQALPTTCPKCKGKGWHYRENYADNILHAPESGYGKTEQSTQ
jgi:hypothetical protein